MEVLIIIAILLIIAGIAIPAFMKNSPSNTASPQGYGDFVTGKVVEVFGNLPELVNSQISFQHNHVGLISSDEASAQGQTVQITEPVYILHVQTPAGLLYVVQVEGGQRQTIHGLASVIKVGSLVQFPTKFYYGDGYEPREYFSQNRMGKLNGDELKLLPRKQD